jgi:hypothetical protein
MYNFNIGAPFGGQLRKGHTYETKPVLITDVPANYESAMFERILPRYLHNLVSLTIYVHTSRQMTKGLGVY